MGRKWDERVETEGKSREAIIIIIMPSHDLPPLRQRDKFLFSSFYFQNNFTGRYVLYFGVLVYVEVEEGCLILRC